MSSASSVLPLRELDALTDIEDPLGGARLGFPAFEQFAVGLAVVVDFDQAVPAASEAAIMTESA